MSKKLFRTVLLAIALVFSFIASSYFIAISPIHVQASELPQGSAELSASAEEVLQEVDTLSAVSALSTSSSGVSDADNNLDGINIVHRDLSGQRTTFEKFNMGGYEASAQALSVGNVTEAAANLQQIQTIPGTDMHYLPGYTPAGLDEPTAQPNVILPPDERVQIVQNAKISPYIKTAFLEAEYDDVPIADSHLTTEWCTWGTAFLVGPNLVLTAGHNVYRDVTTTGDVRDDEVNPRFPDKIKFYFGISNESEISESYPYYAEAEAINIEYSYYIEPNFDHDWALVELDRDIGDEIGWNALVSNWYSETATVLTYGYPFDKDRATMWAERGTFSDMTEWRYYSDNIDSYSGQSGSPYQISVHGVPVVCGIHTFEYPSADPPVNGGTRITDFILSYVHSYSYPSGIGNYHYDYLELSVAGKSGSTWLIEITNTSPMGIEVEYNTKMCYWDDARNWTGLNDVAKINLKPYETKKVNISENWFATSIACSYIDNGHRVITCANNLSVAGLTSLTNLIEI